MKAKELINILQLNPEMDVMIVSSDMGSGGDVFGPLDDVRTENEFFMLGCTSMMCGDLPTPVK